MVTRAVGESKRYLALQLPALIMALSFLLGRSSTFRVLTIGERLSEEPIWCHVEFRMRRHPGGRRFSEGLSW